MKETFYFIGLARLPAKLFYCQKDRTSIFDYSPNKKECPAGHPLPIHITYPKSSGTEYQKS